MSLLFQLRTFCAALLCAAAGLASAPATAVTLEQAMSSADQTAPALRAQLLATQAAREDASAAGKLPDPRLVLGLQNLPIQGEDRGRLGADGMTMQMVGLMQEVPNRARRNAEVAMAGAAVELSEAEYRVRQLEVRLATAEAWLEVHQREQQLALFDELYEQNRLLEAAVQARLAGGQGSLAEQPVARMERLLLDDRRDRLSSDLAVARAELRSWIGELADQPTAGDWPSWPVSVERYRARIPEQPTLALYEPMGRERQASVNLAQADKRPDWSWEVGYQRRASGFNDMVSMQVTVGLPVFPGSRQNRRLAAREFELANVEQDREAARLRLVQQLEAMVAEHQRTERALERTVHSIEPLAAERAELALADYRAGRGTLDALVSARQGHIETRLEQIERTAALALSRARLELTFGDQP